MPSSVSMMLCLLRLNRDTPNSSSICMSWRDKVGCVMCSILAAFVIFSSLATTKKYFSTRSSMSHSPFGKHPSNLEGHS